MSFYKLGADKGQRDIEQHELISFNSSTKPYSFKIPTHIVESIDVFSSHMGVSRNQLVNQIITSKLLEVFSEFVDGYQSNFLNDGKTEAQILLDELASALSNSDVSEDAVRFLESETMDFIIANNMASDVSVVTDFKTGQVKLEADDA